jgi:predicted DNA-binding transcriptional regulator AlpA
MTTLQAAQDVAIDYTTQARDYTVITLSARINRSNVTIRRMIAKGVLPKPHRLGNELRWPAQVVDAWIAGGYRCQ